MKEKELRRSWNEERARAKQAHESAIACVDDVSKRADNVKDMWIDGNDEVLRRTTTARFVSAGAFDKSRAKGTSSSPQSVVSSPLGVRTASEIAIFATPPNDHALVVTSPPRYTAIEEPAATRAPAEESGFFASFFNCGLCVSDRRAEKRLHASEPRDSHE